VRPGDGLAVLLLRQVEKPNEAIDLVPISDAIDGRPAGRPDAEVAGADVERDAGAFVQSRSEEPLQIVAIEDATSSADLGPTPAARRLRGQA
jgi:hypothetical protein